VTLIHFDIELFREHVIQPHKGITKHARGIHGIEESGKCKAEITLQTDQVIFGGMEYFFNPRTAEQWTQRAQVFEDEWIQDVICFWGGKLDQANLFPVSMETVRFCIHGDAGLRR
jgi:hypothetical protein